MPINDAIDKKQKRTISIAYQEMGSALTSRLIPDRLCVSLSGLHSIFTVVLSKTPMLLSFSCHIQFSLRFGHIVVFIPARVNLVGTLFGSRSH